MTLRRGQTYWSCWPWEEKTTPEAARTVLSCCAAASGSAQESDDEESKREESSALYGELYLLALFAFEAEAVHTSVLTSKTDLKSLDIDASFDCKQT